jgi:anti-anti-sigma factor
MKRHLRAYTEGPHTAADAPPRVDAARRSRPVAKRGTRPRHLTLASEPPHAHRLVLTGKLNRRSAHALETAIEELELAAVQDITVDLTKLDHIDATGVAVIAFHCRLAKRRGYVVSLIPGSAPIQQAFEHAGLVEVLPFRVEDEEPRTPQLVST